MSKFLGRISGLVLALVLAFAVASAYVFAASETSRIEPPKTIILKRMNARWKSRLEVLEYKLDRCEYVIERIENRNDNVYRRTFGLAPSRQIEPAGEKNDWDFGIEDLSRRLAALSVSLDEVSSYARSIGSLSTAVPSIPPVMTGQKSSVLTSRFGYRKDPFTELYRFHSGQDISLPLGCTIYATGNGVVEAALMNYYGYGNMVVVNHGYGYRTLYAHLNGILVSKGDEVKRGTPVGTAGRTGRSTGVHLHYEVQYQGVPQNPMNYMDWSMSETDYKQILESR